MLAFGKFSFGWLFGVYWFNFRGILTDKNENKENTRQIIGGVIVIN